MSQIDETEVLREAVPGLQIHVTSAVVTQPTRGDEFPSWGSHEIHHEITSGRPAGLAQGDQV